MITSVDIKHLRYFIAIAEEGSISAASQRLGIAQPSLSLHVTRVEQELGVTLLERSARGVSMTSSGEILLRHAREICRSMSECHEMVRRSSDFLEGDVSIGLPSGASMVLAVPLVETCRIQFPNVRLRAVGALSGFISQWLQEESLDLAVLYDQEDAKGVCARMLLDEELHFVSSPDSWPLQVQPGTPVRLADLRRLEYVLPSQQHGLRRTVDRILGEGDGRPASIVEMDVLDQIKDLVARGSGHTIMSLAACRDDVARGDLVQSPIVDPPLTRGVYLATKASRPPRRLVRETEQLVFHVVDDLVRRGIWQPTRRDLGMTPSLAQ